MDGIVVGRILTYYDLTDIPSSREERIQKEMEKKLKDQETQKRALEKLEVGNWVSDMSKMNNDFQLIRFEADIANSAMDSAMLVTEMDAGKRQAGRMPEEIGDHQQMSIEELLKMVNSQKEQMWQQDRTSKESFQ